MNNLDSFTLFSQSLLEQTNSLVLFGLHQSIPLLPLGFFPLAPLEIFIDDAVFVLFALSFPFKFADSVIGSFELFHFL